jgi:ATP-dependent exoDNAse (exonuclease V) alpha subunit
MAIFFMQINTVGRGSGRHATAAAAYRAGERIRDERSGVLHNYSQRRDVLHSEIFLAGQFDGKPVTWARNRESLWNTAEHAEKRHNANTAREYEVTLPHELDPERRITLARALAREIAERYKVAVDLAVHEPRPDGDSRNFHAHLLTTTREITPTGLGAKVGLDMSARERRRRDLPDHSQEYRSIRARWAVLTNEALREANIAARVDHRSLAEQGVDKEPQPRIPLKHLKMEQRGIRSEVAERLRAEYRERVRQRMERATETSRAQATAASTSQSWQPVSRQSSLTAPTRDLEEVRRQAREAWLRLRPPKEAERVGQLPDKHAAQQSSRESERGEEPAPPAEEELGL